MATHCPDPETSGDPDCIVYLSDARESGEALPTRAGTPFRRRGAKPVFPQPGRLKGAPTRWRSSPVLGHGRKADPDAPYKRTPDPLPAPVKKGLREEPFSHSERITAQ